MCIYIIMCFLAETHNYTSDEVNQQCKLVQGYIFLTYYWSWWLAK